MFGNFEKNFRTIIWVLPAYIAEGIPFAMVNWVAATMFKDLGHSDTEITLSVASIGIAWSLKPFWAGFLDMFKTKKFFVLSTEFLMGALLLMMGLALNLPGYFPIIIGLMWILAFLSATQDICVDGVYISTLNRAQQAGFSGFQGAGWNGGRFIAVLGIGWVAGYLNESAGMDVKTSWMFALAVSGGLMAVLGLYNSAFLPPGSLPEDKARSRKDVVNDFLTSAANFCNKRSLWGMLAFVFFFRSAEGLLLIEAPLFLQGCLEDGGLQLSVKDKSTIDGLVGFWVSLAGGLLGGLFIAKFTLKRTLFLMGLLINVPNLCYVYLSHAVSPEAPLSFGEIAFVYGIEKFWYSFGFVGNMIFMMQQIAPGKFKMTHYAFATAFMNLVLVPTQMASGPLADSLGFKEFFWLVIAASVPSLIAAWFAPFPQLKAKSEEHFIDDPSDLTDEDKRVQSAAGRATIFTLLALATFLFVDVLFIGWMSGVESGGALVFYLMVFGLTFVLKLLLSLKGISASLKARKVVASVRPGNPYASNALGALIGSVVMLLITGGTGYYVADKGASTDWACAFSDDAAQCLQPDKKPPKQCAEPASGDDPA